MSRKAIGVIVTLLIMIIGLAVLNPFVSVQLGERVVVETPNGGKKVIFTNGFKWAGFFANTTSYPDVMTVQASKKEKDNLSEVSTYLEPIEFKFNDATSARAEFIARFELPNNQEDMLALHTKYRSTRSVADKLFSTFSIECLKNSGQLMSSDMHYGGGRAKLSNDFQNQLENGLYMIEIIEDNEYDSLSKEYRKSYRTEPKKDQNNEVMRKLNALSQFNIRVLDASIQDVDYEKRVDDLLAKKIEARQRQSVAKENLITAQTEMETKEAEGKKRLIEIEYEKKQIQTAKIVEAETKIEEARRKQLEEEILLANAKLEAKRIKEIADAKAYEKKAIMMADGALTLKLDAFKYAVDRNATAIEKSTNPLVPANVIINGGGDGSNASYPSVSALLQMMTLNEASKLKVNPNPSK